MKSVKKKKIIRFTIYISKNCIQTHTDGNKGYTS